MTSEGGSGDPSPESKPPSARAVWPTISVPGFDAAPGARFLPMQRFSDVLISRTETRVTTDVDWPDFDRQTLARQRGRMKTTAPRTGPSPEPSDVINDPAVWIGRVDKHFGHFTIETAPRLVPSLIERPNDLFLFTAAESGPAAEPPAFFWDTLDWFGVPRAQVVLLRDPTLVRDLRVAPLPEPGNAAGPATDHLSFLEDAARRNGLSTGGDGVVFVSRAGLPARSGRMAGEAYLAKRLAEVGVQVVYPERIGLADQLRIYAGARTLVFAEGSAIHGRQLLGYIPQDIVVLNRRNRKHMQESGLQRRCDRLGYFDCITGEVSSLAYPRHRQNPIPDLNSSLARGDTSLLLGLFDAFGLNLTESWNEADFTAARDADVLEWASGQNRLLKKLPEEFDAVLLAHLEEQVTTAGLAVLWPKVRARLVSAIEEAR